MARIVMDYDADIGKVIVKTSKLEAKIDDFADGVQKDMMRLKNATSFFGMGLDAVGKSIEYVRGSAERMGRTSLTESLNRANFAAQSLVDSFLATERSISPLTFLFPEIVGYVKDLSGGLVDLRDRSIIDWVEDAADGFTNLVHAIGAAGIQTQLWLGTIDQEQAVLKLNAMMTDEAAEAAKELTQEKTELTQATKEHEAAEKRIQAVLADTKGYKASMKSAKDAEKGIADLRAELRRLQVENGKAVFTERELADMKLDVDAATQGEKEAARELWFAQNDVNEALKNNNAGLEEAQWRQENARIAWERSKNQIEDARAALENARNATIDNSNAISELNDKIGGEVEKWRDATRAAEEYAAALDRGRERSDTSFEVEGGQRFQSGGGVQRRAHGGAFMAGGAYFINEDPST